MKYALSATFVMLSLIGCKETLPTAPTPHFTVSYSKDSSWTTVTGASSNWLDKVIWGKGQFIIVGGKGTVLRSQNGSDWQDNSIAGACELTDICFDGTGYEVVSQSDTVYTSNDGMTWQAGNARMGASVLHSVTKAGANYYLAGMTMNNSIIVRTSDFVQFALDTSFAGGTFFYITQLENRLFALGSDSRLAVKSEGAPWNVIPFAGALYLSKMVYFKSNYVIASDSSKVHISSDLSNWTSRKFDEYDTWFHDIQIIGDTLYLFGDEVGYYTTTDLASWQFHMIMSGPFVNSCAFNDSVIVTVGSYGDIKWKRR